MPPKKDRKKVQFIPRQTGLPASEEAEKGVLSSFLQYSKQVGEICDELELGNDAFFNPVNAEIFAALIHLHRDSKLNGDQHDYRIVAQYLEDAERLKQCGGQTALFELVTFLPTSTQTRHHIGVLKKKLMLRKGIASATDLLAKCHDFQGDDPIEIISEGITELEKSIAAPETHIESLTEQAKKDMENRMMRRKLIGSDEIISSGIKAWDGFLGGLKPARFYVIGARQKLGKTVAMEIMTEHLHDHGHASLFFQRDMSYGQMFERLVCRRAGIIYEEYDCDRLNDEEESRIHAARATIDPGLIRIHAPSRMTTTDIRAILKREMRRRKIKVVFVDVFTRIAVDGDYVTGLARASNDIRDMIADFGVTFVVAAHVNKDAEKTGRPHPSQLKWCDGLLGDLDTLCLLWSKPEENPTLEENKGKRQELIFSVDANRGPVGDFHVYFDRPRMTFHSKRE